MPGQGTVWVTTNVRSRRVVLSVENTGEHSPAVRRHRPSRFYAARSTHAGVGLAIVKIITQAHDGTLTLDPRDAGGLGVTVQLSRRAAAHRTDQTLMT